MENKNTFYTEIAYIVGIVVLAFGTALSAKADFGMSMVVAPAYLLHLKLSQIASWFSFGVAEYCTQAVLLICSAIIYRKFKLMYLFSFVTAIVYGLVLDGSMMITDMIPDYGMLGRILLFIVGMLLCSFGVSMLFHTYFAPEAYELIVKEISTRFKTNINKTKTIYDCTSCLIAVIMSFAFFGFGTFEGVKYGTIVCALLNGFLIGRFSKLMEHFFEFKDKLKLRKYFE